MTTHLTERDFQRYLDQQVTKREKQQLDQHLATCRTCQQELSLYREIYHALQVEPDFKLSVDFNRKVISRLDLEKKPFPHHFYFENFLAILGILAAVIFIIYLYGLNPVFQIFSNLPPYLNHFWGMLQGMFPIIPDFLKSGYAMAALTILILLSLFENRILRKRDTYFLL
jgi:hypothetical protein